MKFSKGRMLLAKDGTHGITLIALVITIIVLLILAAVSIATLTGENGILTRANDSKKQTEIASVKEQAQLDIANWIAERLENGEDTTLDDATIKNIIETANASNTDKYYKELQSDKIITPSGYEILYSELYTNGNGGSGGETGSLPSTAETTPFLPDSNSTVVEDDLDKGVVVKDSNNNEWTWIVVPKSIYTTATSETDYINIEKDMQTYTAKYKIGKEGYADVWYDGSGNTVENTSNRNDTTGCGLTYDEYNNLKETMLSRVYTNGGFWIGQYEAGSSIIRKDGNAELTMPVVKEGVYPYNYITCSNAQIQTAKMNSGSYTSSLMFGIQRDLVLKYLETSQKLAVEEITSDSKNWGNYCNSNFSIVKGEYSEDYGATFRPINGSYEKVGDKSVLLTTGATDKNSRMNIYDLAGNVFEWTLERSNKTNNPCADRGGMFNYSGSEGPASYRGSSSTSYSFFNSGFRPVLY